MNRPFELNSIADMLWTYGIPAALVGIGLYLYWRAGRSAKVSKAPYPTAQLRWARLDRTTTSPDRLQQAWSDGVTDVVEWRDVPVEIVSALPRKQKSADELPSDDSHQFSLGGQTATPYLRRVIQAYQDNEARRTAEAPALPRERRE